MAFLVLFWCLGCLESMVVLQPKTSSLLFCSTRPTLMQNTRTELKWKMFGGTFLIIQTKLKKIKVSINHQELKIMSLSTS